MQDTILATKTLLELGRPRPPGIEAVKVHAPTDRVLEDLDVPDIKIATVDHSRTDTQCATQNEPTEGQVPERPRVANYHPGLSLHEAGRTARLAIKPVITAKPASCTMGRLVVEFIPDRPKPIKQNRSRLSGSARPTHGTLDRFATNELGRTPVRIERLVPPREERDRTVHSREQADAVLPRDADDEVEPRHLLDAQDPLGPFLRAHRFHERLIAAEAGNTGDFTTRRLQVLKNPRQHFLRSVVRRGQWPDRREDIHTCVTQVADALVAVAVATALELRAKAGDRDHDHEPGQGQVGKLSSPLGPDASLRYD